MIAGDSFDGGDESVASDYHNFDYNDKSAEEDINGMEGAMHSEFDEMADAVGDDDDDDDDDEEEEEEDEAPEGDGINEVDWAEPHQENHHEGSGDTDGASPILPSEEGESCPPPEWTPPSYKCLCKKGNNATCLQSVPRAALYKTLNNFNAKKKYMRRRYVAWTYCVAHSKPLSQEAMKKKRVKFHFFGHPLCTNGMRKLTSCGRVVFEQAKIDASLGVFDWKPKRTTPPPPRQNKLIKVFLEDFVRREGLPNPGAKGPIFFLPVRFTKKEVYHEYCAWIDKHPELVAVHKNKTPVAYEWFTKYWAKKVPNIKPGHAKTDLCNTCTCYFRKRMLEQHRDHLRKVEVENNTFKENLRRTRESNNKSVHIVFDYSQSVRLPMLTMQPKEMFFKCGQIIDIFGIANTTELLQKNFLLPEGKWPRSKGIVGVTSMVHHYLCSEVFDQLKYDRLKKIYMMADNCCAQNKNNMFILYLSLISVTSKVDINYHFQLPGHTKFFPDSCFGILKRKLYKNNVLSCKQMHTLIRESSKCNDTIHHNTIRYFDWESFLNDHYVEGVLKKIPQIAKIRQFEFRHRQPGVVFYKTSSSDDSFEEWFLNTKDNVTNEIFENLNDYIVPTPPLTSARVKQLMEIRDKFILGDFQEHALDFFNEIDDIMM
eukprot:m.203229 g.203229  ORF g.203229 m.203229 type:complete len:654 (+) comp13728_c3_seq1:2020-3981(+)